MDTTKTARTLKHMPTVVGEAVDGAIPYRSIQLLAQARDRNPQAFVHHEPVFADIATYLTPRDLRKGISHWEQQLHYQKALKDVEHVDRLRSLHLAQTYQGIGEIRGTLNPELFHTITTAINGNRASSVACENPNVADSVAEDSRVIHWARGGETTLHNLILLCRTHHTRIHKLHPHNYLRDTGNRASSVACENPNVASSVPWDSRDYAPNITPTGSRESPPPPPPHPIPDRLTGNGTGNYESDRRRTADGHASDEGGCPGAASPRCPAGVAADRVRPMAERWISWELQ